MSTQTLLTSLLRYKAWADEGLLAALAELATPAERGQPGDCDEYRAAMRVFNHACIVDRIFAANLQRMAHAYTATGAQEPPQLHALAEAVRSTDRWYIGYVARLSAEELAESIDFTFTDGGAGRMSREEMLGHVVAHGGYHRGEAGQILTRLTGTSPPDTFTGYLHRA